MIRRAALAFLVLCGCSVEMRLGSTSRCKIDPAGCSADAGGPTSWGEYAASLPVPPCSLNGALVVDTSSDLDRPEEMSLPRALREAAERPGPDTITFDPSVFPAASPTTILIRGDAPLTTVADPVCIDGRGRGVIVDWGEPANASHLWLVGAGSMLVGLELRHLPEALVVRGVVAGCRLGTDGWTSLPGGTSMRTLVLLQGGTLGPGNSVSSDGYSVSFDGDVPGNVVDSFFGVDPVTRATSFTSDLKAETGVAGAITGNRFRKASLKLWASRPGPQAVIERNVFEDEVGAAVQLSQAQPVRFGPGNVVGYVAVLFPATRGAVTLTRNRQRPGGLLLQEAMPVPTLTAAEAGRLTGTCPGPGILEVFSEEADSTVFQAEVSCTAEGPFEAAVALPRGRPVSATYTAPTGRTGPLSPSIPGPP